MNASISFFSSSQVERSIIQKHVRKKIKKYSKKKYNNIISAIHLFMGKTEIIVTSVIQGRGPNGKWNLQNKPRCHKEEFLYNERLLGFMHSLVYFFSCIKTNVTAYDKW